MTMMSWGPSMVVGILCGFNHRGRSLKPGTKPVFDLEIDSFEQLFWSGESSFRPSK